MMRLTEPELVTWCVGFVGGVVVELDPPPPQPIEKAVEAIRISPRQAQDQTPRAVSFLFNNTRGSRRMGSRIPAVAAPETVSVKTTVI
jgi:hypothetical protein